MILVLLTNQSNTFLFFFVNLNTVHKCWHIHSLKKILLGIYSHEQSPSLYIYSFLPFLLKENLNWLRDIFMTNFLCHIWEVNDYWLNIQCLLLRNNCEVWIVFYNIRSGLTFPRRNESEHPLIHYWNDLVEDCLSASIRACIIIALFQWNQTKL